MGVKTCGFLGLSLFLTASISILSAAPQLRLASTTVGPLPITTGSNGAAQTLQAYNAGDGSLSLSAASSASWLAATVGAQQSCTVPGANGKCIPIQVALNTASLQAGTYTGVVTVSDPNAVDAPQTITVTVQMGGGVPNSATLYPPTTTGATQDLTVTTNSLLKSTTSTQNGLPWLSVVLDGNGSFAFNYTYRFRATEQAGMGAGSYSGSVAISGSTFGPDNKTVPVTLQVTSQPIANVALGAPGSFIFMAPNGRIQVRLAQNAPKQMFLDSKYGTFYLSLSNSGMGTLSLTSPPAARGGSWLSVGTPLGLAIPVTIDPSSLAPGSCSGTITLSTNAVNPPAPIGVDLQVVAAGTPWIYFGGAVDNQGSTPVAPGDIASVFGEQLVSTAPASATALPLTSTLGNVQVLVNGTPAPVYYTSYGQINFEIPVETAPGTALVKVVNNGQAGNTVSVSVAARAPRILLYAGYGIVTYTDYTYVLPTSLGGRPAHVGDSVVIWAIGLGATNTFVADGVPSPATPPAVLSNVTVSFGAGFTGVTTQPDFAGLTPLSVGLYQINVRVPQGTPTGNVNVTLTVNGAESNTVQVPIQ